MAIFITEISQRKGDLKERQRGKEHGTDRVRETENTSNIESWTKRKFINLWANAVSQADVCSIALNWVGVGYRNICYFQIVYEYCLPVFMYEYTKYM